MGIKATCKITIHYDLVFLLVTTIINIKRFIHTRCNFKRNKKFAVQVQKLYFYSNHTAVFNSAINYEHVSNNLIFSPRPFD